jgi:septal ring factor EnvC (AmiA/AmiB activator)
VGIGPLLNLIKTAAVNIPWSRVAQNTPLIVDMLGKAKAKIRQSESINRDFEDQLKLLQDENARLSTSLLQATDKIQRLTARVSMLAKVSGFSLLLALAALILGIVK